MDGDCHDNRIKRDDLVPLLSGPGRASRKVFSPSISVHSTYARFGMKRHGGRNTPTTMLRRNGKMQCARQRHKPTAEL